MTRHFSDALMCLATMLKGLKKRVAKTTSQRRLNRVVKILLSA
jgi:hypothetical protein